MALEKIKGSVQIQPSTITENLLDIVNTPTDLYGLTYNASSGSFRYEAVAIQDKANIFTAYNVFSGGFQQQNSPGWIVEHELSTYANDDWKGSFLQFKRYRGISSAPTTIVNGDTIGLQEFWGYDGTSLVRSGQQSFLVEGTISAGIVPGKWVWTTMRADGNFDIRMTLNNAGNVLIGTTTDDTINKLQVAGSAKINVNSTTALIVEQDGVKDNVLVVDTTNGSVGINCTPIAYVHIDGSANHGAGIRNAQLFISKTVSANVYKFLAIGYDDTNDYAFLSSYDDNAGLIRPIILNRWGGNVGIGTISPGTSLNIGSQGGVQYPTGIFIDRSTYTTSYRASITIGTNAGSQTGAGWQIGQDLNGNGTKDFYIYNNNASFTAMLIEVGGKVNVGYFQADGEVTIGSANSVLHFLPRDGSGSTMSFYNPTGDDLRLYAGGDKLTFLNSGAIEMYEISAPSNGAANSGRLFLQDNGGTPGKTQLCIIYGSGTVHVLDTES